MLRLVVGRKLVIFTFLIIIFSSMPIIAGNDLTVVCPANKKECKLSENLVLFDETNIAPGYISSPRKLTVINNNPKDECRLATKASNINGSSVLAKGITVSVVDTNNVWYAGSLTDLSLGNEKALGIVPPKAQNGYQLTVSMNQNLGNEYQGLTTGFDLDLNFTCQLPTPTPTPTASNAASHSLMESNQSVIQDMVLGTSIERSFCAERAPQPPILMTTIPGKNSVTLKWQESNDPLTYYLVAYGTDAKIYEYGNPNIGGAGTNEYTVYGLSADTTYYFAVRAGNGCAPGQFSNQLPGTPNGKNTPTELPAAGFQNGILGPDNYDTSVPLPTHYQNQGKILGINTNDYRPKLYIPLFL